MDEAVDSFKKVVEINPGFSGAHLALASLLKHMGRKEEAELYYRNVLKLDPENKDALNDLSSLYYDSGEFDKGIEILKPLYEARKIILSYMVLSMVYLVVKAKAKVEHFQELRRRLIEAQMREREERKP